MRSPRLVVLCARVPWSSVRSPRGPLLAHPVCGPLRAHSVVLYALTSSVDLGRLRTTSDNFGRLLATSGAGSPRPWSSAHSAISSVILCALTSSAVLCVFAPSSFTRSPRLCSYARPLRGPLRAHPGLWSSARSPLYALTQSVVLCALTPLRGHLVGGPLRAQPVVLYALSVVLVFGWCSVGVRLVFGWTRIHRFPGMAPHWAQHVMYARAWSQYPSPNSWSHLLVPTPGPIC